MLLWPGRSGFAPDSADLAHKDIMERRRRYKMRALRHAPRRCAPARSRRRRFG